MCELFDRLNEPFPYIDYEYNKEDGRVYVNGQAMAERLNKVLGVGFWKYEPVIDTVKIVERKGYNDKSISMVTLLINFEFYNKDLAQWIKFTDAGSQDLNIKMTEGDGTKSAITDGMKKCASRIGVASDLYKGLIDSVKDAKHPDGGYAVLPLSYKAYYDSKGWKWPGKEPIETITAAEAKELEDIATLKKVDKPTMFNYYKVKSFTEMTKEQYEQALTHLNKQKAS